MVLDILAVILGIIYTMRKLDVRRREPEDFPGVARDEFLRWRSREAGIYSLASAACFAKLLLDYAFQFYARRHVLDAWLFRGVGFGLFAIWIAILVLTWLRANSVRKQRIALGINLDVRPSTE